MRSISGVQLVNGALDSTSGEIRAELRGDAGLVLIPTLSTAAGASQLIRIYNTDSLPGNLSVVFAHVIGVTNTGGTPVIGRVVPQFNEIEIYLVNAHATDAFNGTFYVGFLCVS